MRIMRVKIIAQQNNRSESHDSQNPENYPLEQKVFIAKMKKVTVPVWFWKLLGQLPNFYKICTFLYLCCYYQGSANHLTRMWLAAIILLCDYFDSHDSHILANHANLWFAWLALMRVMRIIWLAWFAIVRVMRIIWLAWLAKSHDVRVMRVMWIAWLAHCANHASHMIRMTRTLRESCESYDSHDSRIMRIIWLAQLRITCESHFNISKFMQKPTCY